MPKHRTNIYLTDELRTAVSTRARRQGVSNSEVIRSVLEKELLGDDAREEAQAALRKLAPVLHRRLNEGNASDPDLRIE